MPIQKMFWDLLLNFRYIFNMTVFILYLLQNKPFAVNMTKSSKMLAGWEQNHLSSTAYQETLKKDLLFWQGLKYL